LQTSRIQLRLAEDGFDLLDQIGLEKLFAREVDAYLQPRAVGIMELPFAQLAAGFLQHPAANLDDQTHVFRNRNKPAGCDHAEFLGAIHRRVRVAQHIFWLLIPNGVMSNANAYRSEDFLTIEIERASQLLPDTFCDHGRVTDVGDISDQQGEFIAAQTRHPVARAQTRFQTAGRADQQLIANHMAETIVDDFEAI